MWPWARDLLGDAKPTVLTNTDGFQFEKIAALQPDLIIGTNAGVTQAELRQALQARTHGDAPQGLRAVLLPLG